MIHMYRLIFYGKLLLSPLSVLLFYEQESLLTEYDFTI